MPKVCIMGKAAVRSKYGPTPTRKKILWLKKVVSKFELLGEWFVWFISLTNETLAC